MSTVGYFAHGKCWPDQATATAAHWSNSSGLFITPATTTPMINVVNEGGAWLLVRYSISSTGVITKLGSTALPAQTFPYCDTTEQFFDGMAMGWGIALAMVIAWGMRMVRSQAR